MKIPTIEKEGIKAEFMKEKPFKNREEVKAEIRKCDLFGSILSLVCLLFASLGVISDALDVTYVLESLSWFLLAIVAGLTAILPNMRSLVAKHLFGIEAEKAE